MLKSILFRVAPKLPLISKLALWFAVLMIACYIGVSMVLHVLRIEFDQHQLAQGYAPYIFFTVGIIVVCQLLHDMIRTGPVQIEANIIVEGKSLSEAQSRTVRLALDALRHEMQSDGAESENCSAFTQANRSHAVEILKLIQQK